MPTQWETIDEREWEVMQRTPGTLNDKVERLAVPGGFIYRNTLHNYVTLVFVPQAEK